MTRVGLTWGLGVAVWGCGESSDSSPPGPISFQEVPASTVVESGVRREVVRMAGTTPAPDSRTGQGTPEALNASTVVRYRVDVDPPEPVQAVVIALPGFLAGANVFDVMARALVRRGADSGAPVEVWAVDRRANLLEDFRGYATAHALGDPEIAHRYYFEDLPLSSESYAGPIDPGSIPFVSEWGLATHVRDLEKILQAVPRDERRQRVFLVGHSLGGAFAEAYAAWRFEDGRRGAEDVAGIALLDGVLQEMPLSEDDYQGGFQFDALSLSGLESIQRGNVVTSLPLFGVDALQRLGVLAHRALTHPERVVDDDGRDSTLRLLTGIARDQIPSLTNAAAYGLALDNDSCPLNFVGASIGELAGGPVELHKSFLTEDQLVRPSDPAATYSWQETDEWTRFEDFAHVFADGRVDGTEWYFPLRLVLDLTAVGGAQLPEDGYLARLGLRVFDGVKIDAPILAINSALVQDEELELLRQRVAQTIGQGRRHAGATRSDPFGFRVMHVEGMTHVDTITAADTASNPVVEAVFSFIESNAADGRIFVDAAE